MNGLVVILCLLTHIGFYCYQGADGQGDDVTDACLSSRCLNDGWCVVEDEQTKCLCKNNFTGEYCEKEFKVHIEFENTCKVMHFLEETKISNPIFQASSLVENPEIVDVYSLRTDEDGSAFTINETSGALSVDLMSFDYEEKKRYELEINLTGASSFLTVTLTIEVTNINDNDPEFINTPYESIVMEYASIGTLIAIVTATDRDGNIDPLTYRLGGPDDAALQYYKSLFSMNSLGRLTVLPLFVKNLGGSSERQRILLSEDTVVGIVIFNVTEIVESHEENDFKYRLSAAFVDFPFQVNYTTGQMLTVAELDREKQDVYIFSVIILEDNCVTGIEPQFEVMVSDINDELPTFNEPSYSATLREDVGSNGTIEEVLVVPPISARDKDIGINAKIRYTLSGKGSELFSMDPETAVVRTISNPNFDYENTTQYNLEVRAQDLDGQEGGFWSVVDFTILISDFNDNAPIFDKNSYSFDVLENAEVGTVLEVITATDADSGLNGEILFYVKDGGDGKFRIDLSIGELTLASRLDREERAAYTLTIATRDQGLPVQESVTFVFITVLDVNDNTPMFTEPFYIVHVNEETEHNNAIFRIAAFDFDEGENGEISYTIDGPPIFTINSDGDVLLNATLDREIKDLFELKISASDNGTPRLSSSVQLQVIVDDVNDNSPVFSMSTYRSTMLLPRSPTSAIPAGSLVTVLAARDDDIGENAEISFSIQTAGYEAFAISDDGIITLQNNFTPSTDVVTFNVSAEDGGRPPNQDTAKVLITFEEPSTLFRFNQSLYEFSVRENVKTVLIGEVEAIAENDADTIFFYELPFAVHGLTIKSDTGEIFSTMAIDRETTPRLMFNVLARSTDNSEGFAFAQVNVVVEDENDRFPTFLQPREPMHTIEEGLQENTLNDFLLQIRAIDDDYGSNGNITLSIIAGDEDEIFSIIEESPGLWTLKNIKMADREYKDAYQLEIMAIDNGDVPLNSTITVYVGIIDQNDNTPTLWTEATLINIREALPTGTLICDVIGSDEDEGENAAFLFELQDDSNGAFVINETTGSVRTTTILDRESQETHRISVIATDKGRPSLTSSPLDITIQLEDINDNAPQFQDLPYQVDIRRDFLPDSSVFNVSANDPDVGQNALFTCNITGVSGCSRGLFEMNSTTYEIKTTDYLFEEQSDNCLIDVACQDQGIYPQRARTTVIVAILEVNHPPVFEEEKYHALVYENTVLGSIVQLGPSQINATDVDEGENGVVLYEFHPANSTDVFDIDVNSGQISISGRLDRERVDSMTLVVVARDDNIRNQKSATTLVVITIGDVNDNGPYMIHSLERVVVPQESHPGYFVKTITAMDDDDGDFAKCRYSFIPKAFLRESLTTYPTQYFSIDESSGNITTEGGLHDMELTETIQIQLFVKAENIEPLAPGSHASGQTFMTLLVIFEYSYQPACDHEEFVVQAPEDIREDGSLNVTLKEIDDVTKHPELRYAIKAGNKKNSFAIDEKTGNISVIGSLDYSLYNLTIAIRTNDVSHGEGFCSLIVNVDQQPFEEEVTTTQAPSPVPPSNGFSSISILVIIILAAVALISIIILITLTTIYYERTRPAHKKPKQKRKEPPVSSTGPSNWRLGGKPPHHNKDSDWMFSRPLQTEPETKQEFSQSEPDNNWVKSSFKTHSQLWNHARASRYGRGRKKSKTYQHMSDNIDEYFTPKN
ncbi:protocadherin Fat 4-like [Ptychodera flava]|uniref:protocadherin Fat 4-like n=1 Tax=Ptychodera flava TaxID=63121 RepID=UPI00396A3F5D